MILSSCWEIQIKTLTDICLNLINCTELEHIEVVYLLWSYCLIGFLQSKVMTEKYVFSPQMLQVLYILFPYSNLIPTCLLTY